MPTIFFVSSIGDTDLAKATIAKLIEADSRDTIFLVPITLAAQDRVKDLKKSSLVKQLSLGEIVQQPEILSKTQINKTELEQLTLFINANKIQRAYVGVPSPTDEEIPFQIASSLEIPCIVAYEYMFSAPSSHKFWDYLDTLALQKSCEFAVPLQSARTEIEHKNKNARVHTIGHISIDRALSSKKTDTKSIRNSLSIDKDDECIFISGTTQPAEVDQELLKAFLEEIATGKYKHLQLRFGMHPGVKNPDDYLNGLLKICADYPKTKNQFKIILTPQFKSKLSSSVAEDFILEADISGPEAAQAADKLAQAVPGALLNEAALKGKPAYFHKQSSIPYLPSSLFSENIPAFFSAKAGTVRSHAELELKDTAPGNMLGLMKK